MKKEGLFSKVLITLVALIGFLYIGIAWYYQDQFLYNTRIGIVNASWMTVEEVEARLAETIRDYTLTLEAKDGTTAMIKGEDIDLKYEFGAAVQEIKDSQNELAWLPALLSGPVKYDVQIPIVYDADKLTACLAEMDFLHTENMIQPVNASLDYSEENGFLYTQSVEGNKINFRLFTEKLKEALLSEADILNLSEAGCYILPEVTEDDPKIKEMADRLNAVTDFEISYAFGETEEVLTKEIMWKWYRLDENGELVLDDASVKAFVAELAKKYNTVGAKRDFTTHKGEVIQVENGPYGWTIHQAKEYEALLALVKAGKSEKGRQPIYSKTGFGERDTSDIGNTYIEICIEEQKMYYFEDGKLYLETDVVTGNGGRHTQRGVAFIHNKARNATLVGDDYVSFVKYWMKVWNGVGIHDASWRNKFGGQIYLTNGSHGCINTPLENVIKLYERVKIGTPVVIY